MCAEFYNIANDTTIDECLKWCNKTNDVCYHCSKGDFKCPYDEGEIEDYYDCVFANDKVKVRINKYRNGEPEFSFHSGTNVPKGIFNIDDGVYIPEGTLVRIKNPNSRFDGRIGYVSHPISSGSSGTPNRNHYILSKKPDSVQDCSYGIGNRDKYGNICSCHERSSMSYGYNMFLECIKETPELKEQASLCYYHKAGYNSFYYSPDDTVKVNFITGGGWNDYSKIGYIDEMGQIWNSLDKENRTLINHEGNFIRQIGEVELLYHKGEPTQKMQQYETNYQYRLDHPTETHVTDFIAKNSRVVPNEVFGWFLYIVIMIFLAVAKERVYGWVMCTMFWLLIRYDMRKKYIK